jgi:putative transposase
MTFTERRLPHLHEVGAPVFLTWRLAGSLPRHRWFAGGEVRSGKAFVAMDRLLDDARTGPFYLRVPSVAGMVVEAIRYNGEELGHYDCHSFVVMANHVHLLVTPKVALGDLTRSLKSITARRGNELLGLRGRAFWQDESYDRLVRDAGEFERIARYIENNPVRAGLVGCAEDYLWSSAGRVSGGSPLQAGGPAPR